MQSLQVRKFAAFAGSNIVESLSSTAMGMAVGAVAPSTESALVIGPAVMLVFIVFGGLYTNPDDMPNWLSWVPNTSGIKTGCLALFPAAAAARVLAIIFEMRAARPTHTNCCAARLQTSTPMSALAPARV
jgi:ABC-type multidrug transport system permease subunit